MIVLEVTEDKYGKLMKAVSEITKHSECLASFFEDMADGSRYGMRRSSRRSY